MDTYYAPPPPDLANFLRFTRYHGLMKRALGRHFIERIEAGISVAQHTLSDGTVYGTRESVLSLLRASRFPHKRIKAAVAKLAEIHPGIDFEALHTLSLNVTWHPATKPREEEASRA